MLNLFLFNETFTNGLNYSTIDFISLASVPCGIFVNIIKNYMMSVLFLIAPFLNIAAYIITLVISFICFPYLLVYVADTLIFLSILYSQLVKGKSVSRYPWLSYQFYADLLQGILNRAYSSLEWCLSSPPKPHALPSLPLQSRISFKGLIILFLVAILVGVSVRLPFVAIFKHLDLYYVCPVIFGINAALVNLIRQGLEGSKSIDLKKVVITFSTSVLFGAILCILNFYFKEIFLEWIGEKIGLIATLLLTLPHIINFFYESFLIELYTVYKTPVSLSRPLTYSMNNWNSNPSAASTGEGSGTRSINQGIQTVSEYKVKMKNLSTEIRQDFTGLDHKNTIFSLCCQERDIYLRRGQMFDYFRLSASVIAEQNHIENAVISLEDKIRERESLLRQAKNDYKNETFKRNFPLTATYTQILATAKANMVMPSVPN